MKSRVKEAAEKATKRLVRNYAETQISLPFISAGAAGLYTWELTLTRAKFDELTRDLV